MESNSGQEPGGRCLVHESSTVHDRPAELALEDVARFYTARRRNFFVQAFAIVRKHTLVVEVKSGKTIQSAVNWTSPVLRNLVLNSLRNNLPIRALTHKKWMQL